MAIQTNDELIRVADEWFRNFRPSNLVIDGPSGTKNAELIMGHCFKRHGIVTISGLTEAVRELGSQLEFVKEPTATEIAAKQEARMRKDYADSIAPQSTLGRQKLNQGKADAEKKIANDKEYRTLLAQIEFEISNYTVGHPSGGTDYSRTDSGRSTLRQVLESHDRRTIAGAKLALSAVRAAKNKL